MIRVITTNSCSWCVKAKDLLKTRGYVYQEVKIPHSLSMEDFYALADKNQTPKTVPKIFDGKELIGGYEDLVDWLDNQAGGFGEGSLS
jgi:glutaredoxin